MSTYYQGHQGKIIQDSDDSNGINLDDLNGKLMIDMVEVGHKTFGNADDMGARVISETYYACPVMQELFTFQVWNRKGRMCILFRKSIPSNVMHEETTAAKLVTLGFYLNPNNVNGGSWR